MRVELRRCRIAIGQAVLLLIRALLPGHLLPGTLALHRFHPGLQLVHQVPSLIVGLNLLNGAGLGSELDLAASLLGLEISVLGSLPHYGQLVLKLLGQGLLSGGCRLLFALRL